MSDLDEALEALRCLREDWEAISPEASLRQADEVLVKHGIGTHAGTSVPADSDDPQRLSYKPEDGTQRIFRTPVEE